MNRLAVAALVLAASVSTASADEDFDGGTIIFPRAGKLYRVDAKGKNETEVASLPSATTVVRAIRTDATGTILLADLDGKWSWMPLDGSATTFTELPCGDGPAALAEDASCVLCRSAKDSSKSIVYNLWKKKSFELAVPTSGSRISGQGDDRKVVWQDADGIWSAPPGKLNTKTKVVPDVPKRGFLASPSGDRAVGTYEDEVYTDAKHHKPGDVLMGFALDGTGARRKGIKDGVPVDWTHDSGYVLVQNGAEGCEMRASGGEYKCFKGFTITSAHPTGRWMVLLGARDPKAKAAAPAAPSGDDVAVGLPTGQLAIYRGRLEGLLTEQPTQIVKVVDGAAVWIPGTPKKTDEKK